MRALALATRLPSDWRWTLAAVAPRDVIGLDGCRIAPALARADTGGEVNATHTSGGTMYRPTNDSDFDATYRDYLTSGHVALGALDAPTLDELASCARAKLACPAWETDAALANFAADCEAGARRLLDALYGTGSQPAIRPGTFYVMDRLARSVEAAIVSGPHATRAAADADRRTWNSAGDYVTARATLQGGAIHIIEDREV